ncbi:hypothetical protein DL98DRAFT_641934 [Cadophora sp. DSE1049]|nr:hypothetical protein DL98DRAFT_641934 [Cadophora sp. DSE1049]
MFRLAIPLLSKPLSSSQSDSISDSDEDKLRSPASPAPSSPEDSTTSTHLSPAVDTPHHLIHPPTLQNRTENWSDFEDTIAMEPVIGEDNHFEGSSGTNMKHFTEDEKEQRRSTMEGLGLEEEEEEVRVVADESLGRYEESQYGRETRRGGKRRSNCLVIDISIAKAYKPYHALPTATSLSKTEIEKSAGSSPVEQPEASEIGNTNPSPRPTIHPDTDETEYESTLNSMAEMHESEEEEEPEAGARAADDEEGLYRHSTESSPTTSIAGVDMEKDVVGGNDGYPGLYERAFGVMDELTGASDGAAAEHDEDDDDSDAADDEDYEDKTGISTISPTVGSAGPQSLDFAFEHLPPSEHNSEDESDDDEEAGHQPFDSASDSQIEYRELEDEIGFVVVDYDVDEDDLEDGCGGLGGFVGGDAYRGNGKMLTGYMGKKDGEWDGGRLILDGMVWQSVCGGQAGGDVWCVRRC